jgi:hypothetical protein
MCPADYGFRRLAARPLPASCEVWFWELRRDQMTPRSRSPLCHLVLPVCVEPAAMARENISYDEARLRQVESIAARRLGDPNEFGATCAFLCSAFAGFMSGQNLHLDGGSYPALI